MILIDIQDNIIKAKKAIDNLENDSIYRVYRSLGGLGNFEMELRKVLNDSIGLRNSVSAILHGIIMATKDKDLIKIIEFGYFDKITDAVSKESLIKIVTFGTSSFTIPETASKMVAESKEIALQIERVGVEINSYNLKLLNFRQQRNKMFFTLYHLPILRELPQPIESGITLHSLLEFTDTPHSISPEKTEIMTEIPKVIPKSIVETPASESKLKGKMIK
jgi:nucleoid DNA-binding protein